MVEAQAARRVSISGLYALTPELENTRRLVALVTAALDGGAAAVQYRNKTAGAALRLEQARALRKLCSDRSATFIVNDDIDLAIASAADGVHLGRDDVSLMAARSRLGDKALIGASCYDSLDRAEAAIGAGSDYIAFGSFFASRVKPDAVRPGISLLTAAKQRWSIPIVAIGGITPTNAAALVAAGADAVAVISALFDAANAEGVASAARAFSALFRSRDVYRP
ncbi:MAG TPA: thiamine phosphate synthase [Casimicrobiaceae bacterium]|nr:thiamine phosphate synthase [Casimicrobiaceae bacterium]